jgi:alanine dehydrogenase
MIIGVPKEIKQSENRVALTPAGVMEFVSRGHQVYVQTNAGEGSGFPNDEYETAGAKILPTIEDVYAIAEMIIKVKEPIEKEYSLIKPNQLLFTYFHFASYEPLTKAMIASNAVCLAYETVESSDRSLPLLVPMSEVAGRMAIQQGAKYLEKPQQGTWCIIRWCTRCTTRKGIGFRWRYSRYSSCKNGRRSWCYGDYFGCQS